MNKHNHRKTGIKVCSLNVNHSNVATHAAMDFLTTCQDPPFNVILIQEPWWHEINSTYSTVSLAGWQLMLPKPSIPHHQQPRMATYNKLGMGISLTLTTDIAQDLDFMILDIGRKTPHGPT